MITPNRFYIFISLFMGALLLTSCGEEADKSIEEKTFTSIFDNNHFDSAYYPLDIAQTTDGGYLILGRKRVEGDYAGTYILKATKYGNFEKEIAVASTLVNPLGELTAINGQYHFFCMDTNLLTAQLISIDEAGNIADIHAVDEVAYPCAAYYDTKRSEFVLLGYDHVNRQTTLARVSPGGVAGSTARFDLGAGGEDQIEEAIINHFLQQGRKLPFQAGVTPEGLYYFNGFHDYTLSLVFTALAGDNDVRGIVYGQHDDGGFSALTPLGGSKFAAARFNFGDNYFLPNVSLQTNGPSNSVDLGGKTLPELSGDAPVRILRTTVAGKNILVYGSDTRSKQIGLFFYDEATGEFISSKYLGFSNPFEIGSIIQTADEGLMVCGTTYLAGRFPRICLFKMSSDELAGLIN